MRYTLQYVGMSSLEINSSNCSIFNGNCTWLAMTQSYLQNFDVPKGPQEQGFQSVEQLKNAAMGVNMGMNHMNVPSQLDYQSFDFHQDFEQPYVLDFNGTVFTGGDVMPQISGYQQNISPPPSAFLGPKCALWDCPRPALHLDWSQKSDDYCSVYHAGLAPSEGYPGSPPVVRPGGIGLKDNLLFAALGAKAQGKDVGVPECEGAATTKSPWNAPGKLVVFILFKFRVNFFKYICD